jgi:hypothetical protein
MAPAKPSVQNQYVLDAMGEAAHQTSAMINLLEYSQALIN